MSELEAPLLVKDIDAAPITAPPPSSLPKRSWPSFIAAALLGGLIASSFHIYASRAPSLHLESHKHRIEQCPSPSALPINAPRPNPWKNLDLKDAVDIRTWLMDPEQGLNLTKADEADDGDNWIHLVERFKPGKDEALAYLSGEQGAVERYAHAVIHHGSQDVIVDYLVGPLPLTSASSITPLTSQIYHNPIPLNARSTFNWTVIRQVTGQLMTPLDGLMRDVFNGSVFDGTLTAAGTAPMSYDGEWRRSWIQMRRNVPGSWLHGVDLYAYVDMSGIDTSQYKLLSLVHNQVVYNSTDTILEAWKNGSMVKNSGDLTSWATRKTTGKLRDLDERRGPRSFLPDGSRYRVDPKEGYVSWMGWTFYTSFERDMGLHLWDINFRGERVIYELSPQEAMAQYSGDNPHQASCVWLDRAFGMGGNVREVILGYDCPVDATLLDATIHQQGSSTRHNAICVFERESGRPLSRHFETEKNTMGAVKGFELVVRTISTVGNYDYIFDYTFMLDGTIEIRVSASGYLQGGVWSDDEAEYGHKIRSLAMGSLHDHVMNFKVDFDVAGRENTFLKVDLEVEAKDEDWFEDDWGKAAIQQKVVKRVVENEAAFDFAPNMEGTFVVTNQEARNAWGHPRGYALHPGPLCRLTNLDSKRTERNVEWAKHHVAVTRQKDREPSSSSMWNINLPGKPPVDFGKFLDGEDIQQEDLVVWVNLGTHHIPRAEDSPNTLTNVATSYMLLTPYNYNDADVSLESRNAVLVNRNKRGAWEVEEKVNSNGPVCAPRQDGPVSYGDMEGWREDGSRRKDGDMEAFQETTHGLRGWSST